MKTASMFRVPSQPDTRLAVFAVAAIGLLIGMGAQQTQASILTGSLFGSGAADAVSLEDLEARLAAISQPEQETAAQPTDGMSGDSDQPEWLVQQFLEQDQDPAPHHAYLSPTSGGAGSSTTSTSSAGGSGGMSLAVLDASAADLSDDSPLERYAAERALFLPDAPGLELLRPPQA